MNTRKKPAPAPQPTAAEIYATAADHFQAGRLEQATVLARDLLARYPEYWPGLNLAGVVAAKSRRMDEAEQAFRALIRVRPDHVEAHQNLAGLLQETQRPEAAEAAYRKALALKPDAAGLYFSLGNLLLGTERAAESEALFRKALELDPRHAGAHAGLGGLLNRAHRHPEAEAACRAALAIDPDQPEALHTLGNLLMQGRSPLEAAECFERALQLRPDFRYAPGKAAMCRAMAGDWTHLEASVARLTRDIVGDRPVSTPFAYVGLADDPHAQRRCAEIYTRDKFPAQPAALPRYRHAKIRLAYVSPDFHNHPVAHLMADLIEQHDRSRFEVVGLCVGRDTRDAWRQRLEQGCDRFVNGNGLSDEALAAQFRELEIDIAVDLAGHTRDAKTGLFARRAAPVQVNYLGYPGTLGAEFIDYLIADGHVVPERDAAAYAEHIVRLPHAFMPSAPRHIAAETPSREDLGLPAQGFVFCSFNNTYKIQPRFFTVWMRLLRQVEGSVLWLPQGNPTFMDNLKREAQARAVDPARLVFAPKLPDLAAHFARYRQADLFLDTLPYNAHTTAGDALWAGLPVLTLTGQAFAGRVAGSLLKAAGLPGLITDTLEDYESLALRLATHPDQLAQFKRQLQAHRETHPLFDLGRFRRHIEAAYLQMWETHQRGEPPRSFAVEPVEPDPSARANTAGTDANSNPRTGPQQPDLYLVADQHYAAGRFEAAEQAVQAALAAQPARVEALNLAAVIAVRTRRVEEAEQRFRELIRARPDYVEAYNNLAVLYRQNARPAEAEAMYRACLARKPDHVGAHSNLGNLLRDLNRPDEAEAAYRKALEFDPNNPNTQCNLGGFYFENSRWAEALACFERALALDPDFPYTVGHAALCRGLLCDWSRHAATQARLVQGGDARLSWPFAMLGLRDDPDAQRGCAERYVRDKFPGRLPPAATRPGRPDGKIRLAYVSPDFHDHPVAHLMADLIERHDRSRFEVVGVAVGPAQHDAWRARLERGFDRFLDGHGRSDAALAERLRALDIDIAVDLAGHTRGARPGLFALRPAPVQVNYLGYPGTLGAEFIDYILADRHVIPAGTEAGYREAVAHLPDTFQCAARRQIAAQTPSREALGLPAQGFVFCCFNNAYKLQPTLFDIWMRLLRQVPGAVLWLYQPNPAVEHNLRREAEARGVAPERLVFGARLPLADYLARYRQADLFLDTLPYNAGTTASDALWAGLPVLTCAGRSFAGRMGASVLRAAGLPELIADTLEDYEALALRLATHPDELARIKRQLAQNLESQPLFDVGRFRRHIEAAYVEMWETHQRGEPPRNFAVAPEPQPVAEPGREGHSPAVVATTPPDPLPPAPPAVPRRDPYSTAVEHYLAGRDAAAEQAVRAALAAQPERLDALNLLAVIHADRGHPPEAEALYRHMLRLKPDFAEAHNNLGNLLNLTGRQPEAEAAYRLALQFKPDYPDAHANLGNLLSATHRLEEAEAAYRRALALKPDSAGAHNGLGNVLKDTGRAAEAEAAYRLALAHNPNHADAHNGLGVILRQRLLWDEAESCYRKALALAPDHADAHQNLGQLHAHLNRLPEALACFEQTLSLRPDYPYVLGVLAHHLAMACEWSKLAEVRERVRQGVRADRRAAMPFALLACADDPGEQRRCAEIHARDRFAGRAGPLPPPPRLRHPRIRLGYVSADFHNHATAHLIAELLERHDRARFEVYGISYGPALEDGWRARIRQGCDHFLDLGGQSDAAIARQIRALEIDIAIDLKGYTLEARTGIFAPRPAPIQVNYLGYPGTLGAEFIDYLLADRYVVPEDQRPHYTEQLAYLPDSYQCNTRRDIAAHTPERRAHGLPEQGFVFCCFNNTYKIEPALFDIWMRLLQSVAGSVLWLLKANPLAETHLRREAQARGVDPERLVFAPRLPLAEHLARHRHADLFLDTWAVNAHTTASDALWAGLPVLTLAGRSFAARVAGSLLRAVGLPELITDTPAAYEGLALRLATHPDPLAALKRKLETNRLSRPLFDTERFRRHLEAAYREMWEIWQRGEPPRSFAVAPDPDVDAVTATPPGRSAPEPSAAAEPATPPGGDAYAVALAHYSAGRLEAARQAVSDLLAAQPAHLAALNLAAVIAARTQRPAEAEAAFRQLLRVQPDDPQTHRNLGILLRDSGRRDEAIACYQRVAALLPQDFGAHFQLGQLLAAADRPAEAEAAYRRAVELKPDHPEAHNRLGLLLDRLGRDADAERAYRAALALNPDQPGLYNKLGILLDRATDQTAEAEAAYRAALTLKPDYPEALNNLGLLLARLERFAEAEAAYRLALALNPDQPEHHNNLGLLLGASGRFAEAEAAFRQALALNPDHAKAHYNLGALLARLDRAAEAEAAYRRALRCDPDHADSHNNLGGLYFSHRHPVEALACFERVVGLRPDYPYALGTLANCRALLCDWPEQAATLERLRAGLDAGLPLVTPFAFLGFDDDPAAQRRCAEIHIRDRFGGLVAAPFAPRPRREKIRLAYISPDFYSHPVAQLMAELIESHDRARFEVVGVAIGPAVRDEWRERLERGCDRFLDGHADTDAGLARRLREMEIDIAVDLAGHTHHARPGVFARRPAPVQVNYLGYPGTLGAEFIDYLLVDGRVVPAGDERFYAEKIVRLPGCFHPAAARRIAASTPSRRELGLPEQGFVFCAFHTAYKIQAPWFARWLRLLARVPDSVLWLQSSDAAMQTNLQREAQATGLDPARLVFAPKLPGLAEHFARYRQADLFLDALPYNAHTTAGDALWAGLPVLTCPGRSLAGRVAASLLDAAGLPELIAATLEDYEALALRLATQPDELARIKRQLAANHADQPLFDPALFRRRIEAAYTGMWGIWQRGEPPRDFAVEP